MLKSQWNDKIFNLQPTDFNQLAIEVFHFQNQHNKVYNAFVKALGIVPAAISSPSAIPFLPIRFFKSHQVVTTDFVPATCFESSGTTASTTSRHYVKELAVYKQSFLQGFEHFYANPSDWCVIGLLPSYLERGNSSLVYMVQGLIQKSGHPDSGFYLNEVDKLATLLQQLESRKQKTLIIGVTFALLDFAEKFSFPLQYTTIMETGGMKGRREELTRLEVHALLKKAFSIDVIHSEYGMTELLSQAYSKENGVFQSPSWMKVLVREEEDPLAVQDTPLAGKKAGVINIIDLANLYSCSFIATDDAGVLYPDGSFEVLGRVDNSDIRGCSLMVV